LSKNTQVAHWYSDDPHVQVNKYNEKPTIADCHVWRAPGMVVGWCYCTGQALMKQTRLSMVINTELKRRFKERAKAKNRSLANFIEKVLKAWMDADKAQGILKDE
jgi:hypothetical protein